MKRLKPDEKRSRVKNWAEFSREFLGGSDLSAAVLGATWLDARLQILLESFFVDDAEAVAPLMDGALNGFGARARTALALGLISQHTFADLRLIKDIRNAFAHEPPGLTFGDTRIGQACRQLHVPKERPQFAAIPSSDSRKLFETSVTELANRISRAATKAKRTRRRPVGA